jgi:putative endonuclease
MYTVYVLLSLKREWTYTGFTSDLDDRLFRHNNGYEKSTKAYAPFKLIYTEKCNSRIEARKREKFLKSGAGREFLKQFK